MMKRKSAKRDKPGKRQVGRLLLFAGICCLGLFGVLEGCGLPPLEESCDLQEPVPPQGLEVLPAALCTSTSPKEPCSPPQAGSVEGYASYVGQTRCDPTAKPGVTAFKDLVLKTYPCTGNFGIVRACSAGGKSEHKEGRAWDWKVYASNQGHIAQGVINWLLKTRNGVPHAMARRVGLMYMIWNRRIWKSYQASKGWQAYTGASPHTDHIHFSFSWNGANKKTSFWKASCQSTCQPKCLSKTQLRNSKCQTINCAAQKAECRTSTKGPSCVKTTQIRGYLDGANCQQISGWAQDRDHPAKAMKVHLYLGGPAGDKAATGVSLSANQRRQDLCQAIGSCKHGFSLTPPLRYLDGKAHKVYAYGIDLDGHGNTQLTNSPKTLKCKKKLPSNRVRRHVINPKSFSGWAFVRKTDLLTLADKELKAFPKADNLPQKPLLVKADDGSAAVWVIDGTQRRHIPSPAILSHWRFETKQIVTWSKTKLDALEEGHEWPTERLLVQGSDDAVYILDRARKKLPTPPKEAPPTEPQESTEPAIQEAPSAADAGLPEDRQGPKEQLPDTTATNQSDQPQVPKSAPDTPSAVEKSILILTPDKADPPHLRGAGCQSATNTPPLWGFLLLLLLFCAPLRDRHRAPKA